MSKIYKFASILMICIAATIMVSGCTDNAKAKSFGGTITINLPKGKKLVSVTWKEQELWYLVRDSREGEKPESFEFIEKSTFGVFEGKVVLEER